MAPRWKLAEIRQIFSHIPDMTNTIKSDLFLRSGFVSQLVTQLTICKHQFYDAVNIVRPSCLVLCDEKVDHKKENIERKLIRILSKLFNIPKDNSCLLCFYLMYYRCITVLYPWYAWHERFINCY